MPAQTQIGIRLPADLLVAIDAVVADKQRPGVEYTRSDAIREILYDALKPFTVGVHVGGLEPVLLEASIPPVGANSQLDKGGEGR